MSAETNKIGLIFLSILLSLTGETWQGIHPIDLKIFNIPLNLLDN
jgi:hypothetical protein